MTTPAATEVTPPKRHKYSLSKRQVFMLDELMDADRADNGVCYQDSAGNYNKDNRDDVEFLKSIGFITEYTSEVHIKDGSQIIFKGWTITYHGSAFLFAYHTLKEVI